ncbi:diguanylate cyclase (GGDEF)-like protein [Ruminiclostridium sufflavum DSM 19573]|uniref:Diguanylate cyclase (GGDEF)-like protein n=1 Tax=Ruminiclostridium sufflavum DSM 19573 TaxID=1121337 RepID=A0A318XIB2_9FIRM|nr:GGDEF domain-containing protein [Ruminiclostridium sufflavum]PYG86925.1 diguanylate cyclase (GGDEF)-like protein [Ruminiclostridium sufflavum DSM 19573]
MGFLTLKGDLRKDYLQTKYEYYSKFNMWVIICGALADVCSLVSDGVIIGAFPYETLFNRLSVFIPLAIFLIIARRNNNYIVMSWVSYGFLYLLVINNILLLTILTDISHAGEGYIEWMMVFFLVTYATPFWGSVFACSGMMLLIYLSSFFIGYVDFGGMMALMFPMNVASVAVNYAMNVVYYDHYKTKKQLERASECDPLTGLYNRNKMKNITSLDGNFCIAKGINEISCLLVDIDYFKRVNDEFGHEKGDVILKQVADILIACVRESDIVIRWGGEEFFILLYECDKKQAESVAERIRKSVESMCNKIASITVSIGVAVHEGHSWEESVNHADLALYRAKDKGRNNIVLYSESEFSPKTSCT